MNVLLIQPPFSKTATIKGEMCPAFHTQLFDRYYVHNIRVLVVHCIVPYLSVWRHLK